MQSNDLLSAPFQQELFIESISGLGTEEAVVLQQLGLATDEKLIKLRAAPLGDPIAVRVGGTNITLRRDVCSKINVRWN